MEQVLPFDKSYWIIPGKLMAGQYPKSEEQIHALLNLGIKTFVNLTKSDEKTKDGEEYFNYNAHIKQHGAEMFRKSIEDGSIPTQEFMSDIINLIDQRIASDQPTYVHCWGGSGRTGTTIGCYLIHTKMATKYNVLPMIDYLKRDSPYQGKPSPGKPEQQEFVKRYFTSK